MSSPPQWHNRNITFCRHYLNDTPVISLFVLTSSTAHQYYHRLSSSHQQHTCNTNVCPHLISTIPVISPFSSPPQQHTCDIILSSPPEQHTCHVTLSSPLQQHTCNIILCAHVLSNTHVYDWIYNSTDLGSSLRFRSDLSLKGVVRGQRCVTRASELPAATHLFTRATVHRAML